jgi:RHS repeat-associated protein
MYHVNCMVIYNPSNNLKGESIMSYRWKSLCRQTAFVLCFTLICSLFLPSLADTYAAQQVEKKKLNSRQEIAQLRTEHAKTFLQGDGKTYITEQYLHPIHYLEKGNWANIENGIAEATEEGNGLDPDTPLSNKANRFRVGFAKHSGAKKLVRFQYGKAKVDFRFLGDKKVPAQVQENQVTYKEVYPHTDLVYSVDHSGIKEEWVLNQASATSTFTMGLQIQGAKFVLQPDGSMRFVDEKDHILFTIPRPVMVDANDSISYDVKLKLRSEGEQTYIDLVADAKWLQDPKRLYPVTIDPTLTIQGANDTYDAFVSEKNPTTNYKNEVFLITGTHVDYGRTRSLIQFKLPPLLSGANINSAKLYLNQYATVPNQQVNLYPITSSWSSSTVTWNNQPSTGSQLASTIVGGVGEYNWDITSLAKGWYNGTTKDYGISLRHQTESNDRKSFRSSDYAVDPTIKPKLVITYTINPLGQEPFWTTAMSNVNTYNGNFYLPESDLQLSGRGIPISLVRSYNSQSNTSGWFGYGWTTNLEQHLYDSGAGPILYRDADGTLHSFTPNGDGTYDTSPVLQLELRKNADGTYTLTDASQTQSLFTTSGYLWKMIDSHGNTTTLAYGGIYPVTMTDASGRQFTFTRDANNRITKVTDPISRTTEYSYSTSGDLTNVTKKNAGGNVLSTVTYGYDTGHNLISMTDPNQNQKSVTYTIDDKVNTLSYPITVQDQRQTAKITFTYDVTNRLTTVTDPKGSKILYTHNDIANVVQITQDPTGLNYKQTFTYNTQNQLTSQKDANANAANSAATYQYTYDANGNLKTVTNPLNETTTTVYDANNNPIRETDANGHTTSHEYDEEDNPTSTTDAAIKSAAAKYDVYGNTTAETNLMSSGNNLAINGSFQIDRNADNWPDGWNKFPAGTPTISWVSPGLLASDGVTLGSKCIQITNTTTTASVASQRIPYDPNKTYVFSGYAKANNATGYGMIYAYGFNTTQGTYQAIPSPSITGTQAPTRLHVVINPGDFPAGTNQLEIRGYVSPGGGTGTYQFDGLQVEEEYYGAYNLLENGDLERNNATVSQVPDGWLAAGSIEISNGVDGIDTSEKHTGKQSFRLVGKADKWKTLRQDLSLSGGAGSVLTVSGFSKVTNPNPQGGIYGYIVETYSDTTKQETFTFNFDRSQSHDWQHQTAQIQATKTFDNIKVYYEYSLQAGTAWFDTAKVMVGSITSTHAYEAKGNYETKMSDPQGRTIEATYDNIGNVLTEKVGPQTTSYKYDDVDRLTQVTDAKNGITKYEYDANGNKTKVTNSKNYSTTAQYNELNQVKQTTDSLNYSTRYEYDVNGNQTKTVYPNGNQVGISYNAIHRQTSISYNGKERYTFSYDPNGNLTKETDNENGNSTTFIYDADNKTKTVQETGNQTQYTYDKNGNVTERKYTVGSTTLTQGYAYSSLDQLSKLLFNGVNHAWFTYTEGDQVASRKTADGTITLNRYNGAGELVEQTITGKNGNLLDRVQYTYSVQGNLATMVSQAAGTTQYGYDTLGQLVRETRPDGTIYEYSYDANGNCLNRLVIQGNTRDISTYTYNAADQLASANGVPYQYDLNGNLIDDDVRIYTYDAENRLLSVQDDNSGSILASFTYRSDGMRKTMTTAAGTITFHYDENNNVAYETDSNNQVIASYTFERNNPVSMTRAGKTYYYRLNGHGDVTALTDATGTQVTTYEYDPYGALLKQTGSVENPYLYAGYRYDAAIGFYYLQSRYYDAKVGRFLTKDTFEGEEKVPLSQNRYTYVENNPVNKIDPDGHLAWFVGAAFAAVIAYITYSLEVKFKMRKWNNNHLIAKITIAAVLGAINGGLAGIFRLAGLLQRAKISTSVITNMKIYLKAKELLINTLVGQWGREKGKGWFQFARSIAIRFRF